MRHRIDVTEVAKLLYYSPDSTTLLRWKEDRGVIDHMNAVGAGYSERHGT